MMTTTHYVITFTHGYGDDVNDIAGVHTSRDEAIGAARKLALGFQREDETKINDGTLGEEAEWSNDSPDRKGCIVLWRSGPGVEDTDHERWVRVYEVETTTE
jgi:hypothetical protein